MRWKGRTVLALVLISMVASSFLTIAMMKTSASANATQNGALTASTGAVFSGGSEYPQEFKKLYEAFTAIKKDYIQTVTNEQLVEGAIGGMVGALEDPYSDYMDPKSAEEFTSTLHSTFQGIGTEVTMQNGRVTVVSPFKGSPAERAGLRPNDQILSVNGESLEGLDLHQAVTKIRGPKGTKAVLKVVRAGVAEPLNIVCIRDDIPIETVNSQIIEKNGVKVGVIGITQFSTETAKHFKEQLASLEKTGIGGLVIDVRGNPGGYLLAVKEIGEVLVPKKGVIVAIEYGAGGQQKEEYRSTTDAAKPYPIAVLINGGSASASEILAGAMRDSGNYKLVGEKSFGKGTVQSTMEMTDKSQLKLTIAKWVTPSGEWIHKKGIEPDFKVAQPDYFNATQLPADKELARDMAGADVKNLQLILTGLKLSPGRDDGYFDEKTEQAIKQFQTAKKLPVTGKVDAATRSQLEESLRETMRKPENDLQLQKALDVVTGK
ncbi:peptidase S41 [Brevibacillus agri]|uniref:PDZ domain-containing protein n=1 Tax=Brevibacillus agri TaxID=51101 RepID=A0A3M8B913_9BACL|nr:MULTISPECIES: S41 family peptidase [Brevibacillus]EJL46847.1 C-terminal processing peptidase [Brevibacillus sp. CF112]QAV12293.1 PDZ domain-containing protein [Brevibacillus agri]QHZ54754.1 PDZ domain-containing protein [Brevibacillus sp. NSP2.1]RNB59325.1 PDZ domain-containing protein [Brevibacillus agri]GED26196.1 peptidase S41 [Brevibacillus agri]